MKSRRRHESLIPLSREHHDGLMVCLRIHRGLPLNHSDETWVREKATEITRFFATHLEPHFKAEEEALFPAMRDVAEASELVSELLSEHRMLEALGKRLCGTAGGQLAQALGEFADLLETHIRKEERELFPLYELRVSAISKHAFAVEVIR
jgi:Uncharacterized conserved protein